MRGTRAWCRRATRCCASVRWVLRQPCGCCVSHVGAAATSWVLRQLAGCCASQLGAAPAMWVLGVNQLGAAPARWVLLASHVGAVDASWMLGFRFSQLGTGVLPQPGGCCASARWVLCQPGRCWGAEAAPEGAARDTAVGVQHL